MNDRRKSSDDAEPRLGSSELFDPATADFSVLWEQDQTFLGQLERVATDSPFQRLALVLNEWRVNRSLDEVDAAEGSVSDAYVRSHQRWVFGRPLTSSGIVTLRFLKNRGISARDRRLAVFCRYIREDGSVRVNHTRERLLEAVGISLLALNVVACIDLGARLAELSINFLWKIGVPLTVFTLLIAVQYPLFLLTLRAPRVARRVERAVTSR